MKRAIVFVAGMIAIFGLLSKCSAPKNVSADDEGTWKFAVSGDSRNCGDVVMPVIAERVLEEKAQFYWHLGDFRAIYKVDEDFVGQKMYMPKNGPGDLAISTYQILAWPDFIEHQIRPFGSLPIFLGIGNHETVMPKSREDYIAQFSAWLNSGPVQRQRVADYRWDWKTTAYYHWIRDGVDFVSLDNGTGDQFDLEQINWLETVLTWDVQNADRKVNTIVIGMHKALPGSFSDSHSMSETATGARSGRHVYEDLVRVRDGTFVPGPGGAKAPKNVYVLASHSHYFMHDIFDTPEWTNYGKSPGAASSNGVLDGWIVGTAGAQRTPPPTDPAGLSRTTPYTYGYLLGTVNPGGTITFQFKDIQRGSVSKSFEDAFVPGLVDACFDKNP